MRPSRAILLFSIAMAALSIDAEPADPIAAKPADPIRVVSLNPSLTAILLALDAGPSLVGVDDWSARDLPEVAEVLIRN